MISSYRLLLIHTIFILLIFRVNGGYWICDWVGGRGWMYCSRGICNAFAGKRSISYEDEQAGPTQNEDGTYCVDKNFCYTCRKINENTCRITTDKQYVPLLKAHLNLKRSEENICP